MRIPIRTGTTTGASSSKTLAQMGLLFTVLAWGSSFVAARILLSATRAGQTTLTPTTLAALRFGLASLFFVIPLGRAIARRRVSGGDLLRMAVLGQITYATYFWFQYTGVQPRMPVSRPSLLWDWLPSPRRRSRRCWDKSASPFRAASHCFSVWSAWG